MVLFSFSGPASSVCIATGYGVDGPGIESRWRVEIFRTSLDRPWGPPSLLYNGYRVFPGLNSGRDVTLTPHLLLVPWLRKSRAIPLLPLWALRPVQSLSACTRLHFTITFTFTISFNPFKTELKPICHLLAFLGAHHILHVSRIRVKV